MKNLSIKLFKKYSVFCKEENDEDDQDVLKLQIMYKHLTQRQQEKFINQLNESLESLLQELGMIEQKQRKLVLTSEFKNLEFCRNYIKENFKKNKAIPVLKNLTEQIFSLQIQN